MNLLQGTEEVISHLLSDRALSESLYYFVGIHFIKERRGRFAKWIICRFNLHIHHDWFRKKLHRFVVWLFAISHPNLANALGATLMSSWVMIDIYQSAPIHLYVLDGIRIVIGIVALTMFEDYA